jgi:DNA polymerase-3 subunit gamma/tau
VREIIDSAQYAPVLGKYKIFIIDEVHMLSKSAFNALLKILEEPPSHVKFIFATTEIHKIPETILSRCMAFQLKPVPPSVLSEYLISISDKEGFVLEKDAADIITEESEGSVRDALSILDQAMMLSEQTKIITADITVSMLGSARLSDIDGLLQLILNAKTKEALHKLEELVKNGCNPFMIFKDLQSVLYKKIAESVNGEDRRGLSNLLYLWQILLKQSENMKNADRPEYVLSAIIIILSHTASFPNIEELIIKDDSNVALDSDSKKLVGEILNKFPGAIVSEIE